MLDARLGAVGVGTSSGTSWFGGKLLRWRVHVDQVRLVGQGQHVQTGRRAQMGQQALGGRLQQTNWGVSSCRKPQNH